jgi:hypothetical protein
MVEDTPIELMTREEAERVIARCRDALGNKTLSLTDGERRFFRSHIQRAEARIVDLDRQRDYDTAVHEIEHEAIGRAVAAAVKRRAITREQADAILAIHEEARP